MVYVVNTNELYHHGIQGMHWGIRRYQNNDGSLTKAGALRYGTKVGAKQIKRSLTSLDDSAAEAQFKYKDHEVTRQKYTERGNKLKAKGKTDKANKMYEKAKIHENERNNAEKELKRIDKSINDVINRALKDGYDVKMTQIQKMPKEYKNTMMRTQILLGPIGTISYTAAMANLFGSRGQGSSFSEGYKYKVTPGAGVVTEDKKGR